MHPDSKIIIKTPELIKGLDEKSFSKSKRSPAGRTFAVLFKIMVDTLIHRIFYISKLLKETSGPWQGPGKEELGLFLTP